jgi:hypothetical protein
VKSPRFFGVLVAALLVTSPMRLALAEPDQVATKAAAQALFDEARALTAAGDFEQACPKLLESARLDPSVGTTYYLADCYEHVGKLASAWTYYNEAAGAAQAAGQRDRAEFAQKRAEALKPRLIRLVVDVPEPLRALPELRVTRDGVLLGAPLWGTAVPVDPGRHELSASAAGKQRWQHTLDASEEGKTITVTVPALADPPKPVAPIAPVTTTPPRLPPPPKAPVKETPPPSFFSGTQRMAGLVAGGAGVVSLGIGSAFGAIAMSKQAESNDGPCDADNFCNAAGKELRRQAISAATVSTATFVVGSVALAGGAVLFFTAPTPARPSPPRVSVGPGSILFHGSF